MRPSQHLRRYYSENPSSGYQEPCGSCRRDRRNAALSGYLTGKAGASQTLDRQIKALEEELEKNRRFKQMVFEKYDEKIIEQKTYQEYTEIYSKK